MQTLIAAGRVYDFSHTVGRSAASGTGFRHPCAVTMGTGADANASYVISRGFEMIPNVHWSRTALGVRVTKVVLGGGMVLLAGSIALFAMASSYWMMAVLAAAGGIGNSIFHPADYSVLSASVSESRIGRAYSVHGLGGFAGYGAAPVAMLALGTGNGSVFQLVPQRFQAEIGIMTGLVGMAGGVGGFYLASSLGVAKQLTGSFAPGFLIFAGLALLALLGVLLVKTKWRASWTTGARI